ncbi:hypothetical protein D9757_005432 [Collybiopsis confluens]|uniref:Uncharacterized protein n=1 Tax=Collybiopsis confluens TaxID=2823264 RepID=A0A8H5HLY1_9AGAR|nr:hypothetical protein D9757_005432 [Collybiopsis confluens]
MRGTTQASVNLLYSTWLDTITSMENILQREGVSRTSGDNIALQQCISLLRRLPPLDDNQKPPINEIQPNLNPLDVLYDVKKLIDETNEQPMSASFQKIVEAAGVFDHWCDGRVSTAQESDQWALYTVQATAWNAAGCEGLGDLTADIVLAFTRAGSPDNNRLTALLNIAFRRARQGNYNNALGILLDPSVWSSLSLPDYKLWAEEVWQVLTLRAARRGQDRLYHETLLPHRPPGERNLAFLDSKISLSEVLRMREREASSITMEQLLRTLWHSEFLFRMHHYRAAIVLLADVGLHFGLSKRSQRMIEDMMPQIIIGSDVELRGFAAFTLARCIIVGGQGSKSALQEAAWWLAIAEKDYMALEIYHSAMDVQYLLAVVYNTFGAEEDRDAASERYERTREVLQQLEVVTADAEVNGIIDIISRVGSWEI